MAPSIAAFYAAYLTGAAGLNVAMLAFRKNKIVGTDILGVNIFGTYDALDDGTLRVKVTVAVTPNQHLL